MGHTACSLPGAKGEICKQDLGSISELVGGHLHSGNGGSNRPKEISMIRVLGPLMERSVYLLR
jgi:hypothetical protein